MTILMTGGSGLIGSVIREQLITHGHTVINFTRVGCELISIGKYDSFNNQDVFIHCARDRGYLGDPNIENWQGEFYTDVILPYRIIERLVETDRQLKCAIIVSSIYGVRPANLKISNSPIHYGVCKAAQIHLVKELAIRLAPVRVNAVSYGGVESGRQTDDFRVTYCNRVPLGRMAKGNDLFGPIEYLLNNPYVTGQNIVVDGGMTV